MKKYHCCNCRQENGTIVGITLSAQFSSDFVAHCSCTKCERPFNVVLKIRTDEGQEILKAFREPKGILVKGVRMPPKPRSRLER